jgi:hypothetical protein
VEGDGPENAVTGATELVNNPVTWVEGCEKDETCNAE